MRSKLVVLAFAVALALSPACSALNFLGKTPTPVQLTVAAADAVDASMKLAEIVDQLAVASHKLRLANVVSVETDDAVQNAEIAFAKAKTVAVAQIQRATTLANIAAASAPLVAQATQIRAALADAPTTGLIGTASIVGAQLPGLLKQAKDYIVQLGGK